ncbi:unnamed protein product [Sphenostylis stenocarpa]|uniref:Uncharacterized protein n=1 Tax=Sphenostylis stenocarpa TaxID=92480 RepID=A0AA86SY58_9FABA|nr:unnamed protein product [Sphenostylis stenocarpa]
MLLDWIPGSLVTFLSVEAIGLLLQSTLPDSVFQTASTVTGGYLRKLDTFHPILYESYSTDYSVHWNSEREKLDLRSVNNSN